MRVSNLNSPRSGNPVANQYNIFDDDGNVLFQSYQSIIAKQDRHGTTTLDETYWDYSKTTLKYLRQWLETGEMTADIRKKIKSGKYKLADLNS